MALAYVMFLDVLNSLVFIIPQPLSSAPCHHVIASLLYSCCLISNLIKWLNFH